jgi:hypothetical protein
LLRRDAEVRKSGRFEAFRVATEPAFGEPGIEDLLE